MPVRISPDLELPDNAVTQTFAFIARKGAGKTYAAGKLVEGLLLLNAPVIIFDPVGNWYGLRLSASGKSAGFPIPVFGGRHGDVPIEADQGDALGQLLIKQNLSAVIDVSSFRKNERKRFVTDAAEALFHYAKDQEPTARMIVFEEAQVFAPQRAQAGEERMLGAIEDIVRLGRNYGLGSTMISQRPQSINKEVLNQVECLFVGQLNASHERKAVEEWVMDHKADREWTKALPGLPVGMMIVWSPQWLQRMQEVRISKKTTYDASATPELGKVLPNTKQLSSIDVPALQSALAELAPKKELPAAKVDNAVLNRELESLTVEIERLTVELDREKKAHGLERWKVGQELRNMADDLKQVDQRVQSSLAKLERFVAMAEPAEPKADSWRAPPADALTVEGVPLVPGQSLRPDFFVGKLGPPYETVGSVRAAPPKPERISKAPRGSKAGKAADMELEGLTAGAMRMLDVLAELHPALLTRAQIAAAADLRTTGGAFASSWAKLRKGGYMDEQADGLYRASKKTLRVLGVPLESPPASLEAKVAFWNKRLTGPEQRALRLIVESDRRSGLSREQLGLMMGVVPSGGSFNAAIGTLVRNNLILKQKGRLVVHPWLTGEG